MIDLSIDAVQRIAAAEREAEIELKRALSTVADAQRAEPCIPAFRAFARALCEAEVKEWPPFHQDADALLAAIKTQVARRIVEGIMPDQGLAETWGSMSEEARKLPIEWEPETGILFEGQPDPTPLKRGKARFVDREIKGNIVRGNAAVWKDPPSGRLLRPDAIGPRAPHGDWERFAPEGVRWLLRFQAENALVRAALSQELQLRALYWVRRRPLMSKLAAEQGRLVAGAVPARPNTTTVPQFPARAAWLAQRLAERGWDKHHLEAHGGPEHRTTQKILDGLPVQDAVLRRVIEGLNSKTSHDGRTLARVAENDIPNA
jgi:hypothetical protein